MADFAVLARLMQSSQERRVALQKIIDTREKTNRLLASVKSILDENPDDITFVGVYDWKKAAAGLSNELLLRLDELITVERARQARLPGSMLARAFVRNFLFVGLILNVVIAIALAFFFSKAIVQRLAVMMDNTLRLAREEALHPPLEGKDEISALDNFFHKMADTLAAALRKERAIVNNAVDMICTLDREGRFTAVNPACEQLLGYSPGELLGTKYTDLVASTKSEFDLLQAMQLSCLEEVTLENQLMRKDHTTVDVRWSASWSKQEQLLYCIAHNVTTQKQAERLRTEVVAMVSHDLRSPLTGFHGFLESISEGIFGDIPDLLRRKTRAAQRTLQTLIDLTNDLLDMEKLEAGTLEIFPERCSAQSLIERAVEHVQGLSDIKRIHVEPSQPMFVLADEDRIVQVIVNLLTNALKYSDASQSVFVSAMQNGNEIRFSVTDKGRGVPADQLDNVFQRYKQLHKDDAKGRSGAGLGLAICKSLIDLHHGRIGADSVVGQGSTFWFTLPTVREGDTCST